MRKLILIIIIFAGCNKKEDRPPQPPTSIKVLENITNLPISGADVTLRNYDSLLFQGVTDANGICLVPFLHFNNMESQMSVTHLQKYWSDFHKDTTIRLTPYGWLQLRIHKVGNYTPGSRLILFQSNQDGSVYHATDVNTAEDSLIVAFCFGNQINNINWRVVDMGQNLSVDGYLNGLQIPRFDTLKNVTLDY